MTGRKWITCAGTELSRRHSLRACPWQPSPVSASLGAQSVRNRGSHRQQRLDDVFAKPEQV
jgi:hypothetical protein